MMSKPYKKILVLPQYTVHDPATVNTIKSVEGLCDKIVVIQQSNNTHSELTQLQYLKQVNLYDFRHIKNLKGIVSLAKNFYYWMYLKWFMLVNRPDLVITFMLHPLAALSPSKSKSYRLVSCIYDIPPVRFAGKLDKYIHHRGWKALKQADVVWSSDIYKAEMTKQIGGLSKLPIVCHNVPSILEYDSGLVGRSTWLREQLIKQGAPITIASGCVMIRAGAVGVYGGIEETLKTMIKLPEDFVFLMMGRPSGEYKTGLLDRIKELGLEKRAFLWDRPDDDTWKKAIKGADIGHLLHLFPTQDGNVREMYELNSSLSNYRLFTYMASGLSIVSYNDARLEAMHNEVDCFNVVDEEHLDDTLYSCLAYLYNHKEIREQQGKAARHAYQMKYNWEAQFSDILTNIIKESLDVK